MPKIRGNKNVYSSEEPSQLIVMDSDREGDDVDLGENCEQDSEKDSEWEPDEEDVDIQSEEENDDLNSSKLTKNENQVIIPLTLVRVYLNITYQMKEQSMHMFPVSVLFQQSIHCHSNFVI